MVNDKRSVRDCEGVEDYMLGYAIVACIIIVDIALCMWDNGY